VSERGRGHRLRYGTEGFPPARRPSGAALAVFWAGRRLFDHPVHKRQERDFRRDD
jgi:hypothetical protein